MATKRRVVSRSFLLAYHPLTSEFADLSNLPARTKHPNQYTYRAAKAAARGTRISPAKRQPAHSHKDHAADHPPASKGKAVASASSKEWNNQHHYEPNGWGMPEHLKHLAHFLPSTKPIPIVVPTYSAAQYACQSQDQQSPPPPTTSTVGSHSTLAPHDSAEPILETHFEPPTKIRFPNKRMTMPEMRKRSKHVLEFVGRIQLELQEREKRNEAMKRAVEVGIGAHCSSAQSGLQAGVGSGMALSNGIGGGRAGRGRRWANSSRSSEERVGPREDFNAPDGSVASGSGSANGIVEAEGSQGNFKLIESFSKVRHVALALLEHRTEVRDDCRTYCSSSNDISEQRINCLSRVSVFRAVLSTVYRYWVACCTAVK